MIATIEFDHTEMQWVGRIVAGRNNLFSYTLPKLEPAEKKRKHASDLLGITAADNKWYEDEYKVVMVAMPKTVRTQGQFEQGFLNCARELILHEASRKRKIIHTTNYLEEIWTLDFFKKIVRRLTNRTDAKKHGRGKDLEAILIHAWESCGLCRMNQAERCQYVNQFFARPWTPAAVQKRIERLGLLTPPDTRPGPKGFKIQTNTRPLFVQDSRVKIN